MVCTAHTDLMPGIWLDISRVKHGEINCRCNPTHRWNYSEMEAKYTGVRHTLGSTIMILKDQSDIEIIKMEEIRDVCTEERGILV